LTKPIKSIFYWIGFGIAIIFVVMPVNIFALLINLLIKEPIGLQAEFNPTSFWMFYGLLTLFAIISEFIIALYYHFQLRKGKVPFGDGYGYGMWDYFLRETTSRKIVLLILLLLVSAIAEEIIFRYMALNFFIGIGIPILIAITISAVIFGLAHYSNGGWIYIVNSSFAGFIFALAFLEMGIITAWILHFMWNGLILFQMFIPKLYEIKEK
jgi:membrane protease YdiL (CAAX protease family)